MSVNWRLDVARRIARNYMARPGARAAIAVGSVARGAVDQWSDLDLLVVWDQPDTTWLEEGPLTALGGDRFTWARHDAGGVEQYWLGSLKVDVASMTVASLEQIVDAAAAGDTEWTHQKVIEGLTQGHVLDGEDTIARLRERIDYSDVLRDEMIRAHLRFYPKWAADEMGLDRGDLVLYHDVVLTCVRNALGLVAALNRHWFSTGSELKATTRMLSSVEHAPADAAARIDRALTSPSSEALDDLWSLFGEVLDLVVANAPDVDVTRARRSLDIPLVPVTGPPPLPEDG